MKISTKLSVLMISIFIVFTVFIAAYHYFKQQEYNLYFQSKLTSDQQIIDKVLEFKTESFLKPTIDNAIWDDLAEHLVTKDLEWVNKNLALTYRTYGFTSLNVYSQNGILEYSSGQPGSPQLSFEKKAIKDFFFKGQTLHTFQFSNNQLFEIFGCVIPSSNTLNSSGEERGYLVTTKLWDLNYVAEIEKATGFKLNILTPGYMGGPIIGIDEEIIFYPLKDNSGIEISSLKFFKHYQILTGLSTLKYKAIGALIALILLIIIILLIVNQWLTKPLKEITLSLKEDNPEAVGNLVGLRNEFGEIANLIKQFNIQKAELEKEIRISTDTKERLNYEYHLFNLLMDYIPDYIYFKDKDSSFIKINKSQSIAFGLKDPSEAIGKTDYDFFAEEHAQKALNDEQKIMQMGIPIVDQEEKATWPDGSVTWFLSSKVPLFDYKGLITGTFGVSKDITAQKKTEELLKSNEIRLQDLNATKDKFFSIIAHDLKNPFNAIIGFSDILAEQVREKDYEGVEEYTEIIQSASQRAMSLLSNLLEWSQAQTGRLHYDPKQFDIVSLINEITLFMEDSARQKSIEISKELPHQVLVTADKAMIGTILRNLLSNSVKFTNYGGNISISIDRSPKWFTISVSDNGVGIEKQDQEKLFRIDKSHTTSGTQQEMGTGLGLLLCKEFIEMHGGKIGVESEKGQGSRFYFTIPGKTH